LSLLPDDQYDVYQNERTAGRRFFINRLLQSMEDDSFMFLIQLQIFPLRHQLPRTLADPPTATTCAILSFNISST